jgi:hypothetical protein
VEEHLMRRWTSRLASAAAALVGFATVTVAAAAPAEAGNTWPVAPRTAGVLAGNTWPVAPLGNTWPGAVAPATSCHGFQAVAHETTAGGEFCVDST